MTPEEIRTMQAGLEINALVAKEIMGWCQKYDGNGYESIPIANEPAYLFLPGGWGLEDIEKVPDYSGDIADAWQVVKKMLELGWDMCLANIDIRYWGIDFYLMKDEASTERMVTMQGMSVPLLICRGALLAVMADG